MTFLKIFAITLLAKFLFLNLISAIQTADDSKMQTAYNNNTIFESNIDMSDESKQNIGQLSTQIGDLNLKNQELEKIILNLQSELSKVLTSLKDSPRDLETKESPKKSDENIAELKNDEIMIEPRSGHYNDLGENNKKIVACYYVAWTKYYPSLGQFSVYDIDPFLCTHLIYGYFDIEQTGELRILYPSLDLENNDGLGNIKKFNALKLENPRLKTLASIGGKFESSKNFSIVAADSQRREVFINSTVRFLRQHGFDGIDIYWKYPNLKHKLKNDDKRNFVRLLRELRTGLDPFGYMLTASVIPGEYYFMKSYDIPQMVKYLDFVNVLCFNLNDLSNKSIGIHAPLYAGDSDITERSKQQNVDSRVKYWIRAGIPANKFVLGVAAFGVSFTLDSATKTQPGAAFLGPGIAGAYTRILGFIGYNELCEKFQSNSWEVRWEPRQMVPYAFNGRQWVGFENPKSLELKALYAVSNNLAGMAIMSIALDDFRGICHEGNERFPLLKTINRVLFNKSTANEFTKIP